MYVIHIHNIYGMRTCVCVYIYIYTYILGSQLHVCICMYTLLRAHTHLCAYICSYVYERVWYVFPQDRNMYACIHDQHIYIYIHVHVFFRKHRPIYSRMYVCMYVCMYVYIVQQTVLQRANMQTFIFRHDIEFDHSHA